MAVEQGTVIKVVATLNIADSTIAQNVFYWRLGGLSAVSETTLLSALATGIDALYANLNAEFLASTVLNNLICHEWDWDAVLGKWLTGTYIGSAALSDAFAAGGDPLPNAVAEIVTGVTPDVRVKSRKSLPPFKETSAVDNDLVAASLANLALWAFDWLSNMFVDTNEYLAPVVPTDAGVALPLISTMVGSIVGSQRRRKPGVGI